MSAFRPNRKTTNIFFVFLTVHVISFCFLFYLIKTQGVECRRGKHIFFCLYQLKLFITKYHRLGGLNNRSAFLTVWEVGKFKIKIQFNFGGRLSS